MTFHFSCPQGHVLEGDLNQIGQLFQCPFCGESFTIPSPNPGVGGPGMSGNFMQGLPQWPGPQMQPGYPVQPFTPVQPQQETPAEAEGDKPKFVFDFDPRAKAPLPFDIPEGSSGKKSFDKPPEADREIASEETEPVPVTSPLPAVDFTDESNQAKKSQVLHVRCPSGHALKVSSEQNGKPIALSRFASRSLRFAMKTVASTNAALEKVLSQVEAKQGQVWLA